jgi:hypothetical protein
MVCDIGAKLVWKYKIINNPARCNSAFPNSRTGHVGSGRYGFYAGFYGAEQDCLRAPASLGTPLVAGLATQSPYPGWQNPLMPRKRLPNSRDVIRHKNPNFL